MRSSLHDIADAIYSDYVASGRLRVGDRLPGVRELREQYKTSATTIVHALSVLQRQGIVEKRHGVGCYVVDRPEQPISNGLRTVGFILQAEHNEVPMRVHRGVELGRQRYGCNVLIADARGCYETERQEVQRMVESGCRAIVLYPALRTNKQLATDYLNHQFREFPIVLVDMAFREHKRSKVLFDNYRAGYDMTEFLINEGHRSIAFMRSSVSKNSPLVKSNMDRYQGYIDALRSAEISRVPENEWLVEGWSASHDDLAEALLKWREQPDRPTAVIAVEDITATNLTHVAQDLGIAVPYELRIAGFDNLVFGQSCRPAFPTTDPDFVRAGELAMELAIEHANGTLKEQVTYLLPVPIKVRSDNSGYSSRREDVTVAASDAGGGPL